MRLFVAVDPGERLRADLATRLDTWRRLWDLKWVPPENLHLTLRFLGERPETHLAGLSDALAGVAAAHAPCEPVTGGLDVFPNWRRPRVLFLQNDGADALTALAADVGAALDARFPEASGDDRPFRAHLTLARIKRPLDRPDREALRALAAPSAHAWTVRELRLMESRLTPRGAVYAARGVFPLAGADGA